MRHTFSLVSMAAIAVLAISTTAFAGNNSFRSQFSQDEQQYQASVGRDGVSQGEVAQEIPNTTREIVSDPTGAPANTIVIDTQNRAMYYTLGDGKAYRYIVGVGRAGFEWHGTVRVGRKAEWPGWTPPAAMLLRRPDLPRHMAGGIDNPLGARALYLYKGKSDTGFRIHGTNEADTIGQSVSSGCIRMLNEDVTDLYSRVKVGTTVQVL